MASAAGQSGWLRPALALVAAVTALRWALLAFNRTDLFVDESQYWLWGQHLDWGYFSKPPLVGWLIGGVTRALGSDAPFVIRLPGAALHGATALVLGALAAQRLGNAAALPATALYLLAPFAGLGSLLISTDTLMLPLLAGAYYTHARLLGDGRLRWALATGALIGLACLAKYAGIYALLALMLAQVWPEARLGWRASLAIGLAVLAVLAPNLAWNVGHQFITFQHTGANIGWVVDKTPTTQPGIPGSLTFLASQLAVFGPVSALALAAALAVAWRRPGQRDLVLAAVLPLAVVAVQAFLGKAYANWAVAAYAPGSVLAAGFLIRHRRLLTLGLAVNAALCLALPLATLWPDLSWNGRPILARYLGRADLSGQIIALAQAQGGLPIVAQNRDILADLFYTGRDRGLTIHAVAPRGAPQNYYEQLYPLPPDAAGEVLFVGSAPPALCRSAAAVARLQGQGAWQGRQLLAFRLAPACLAPGR